MDKFKFEMSLSVLNHLGRNLYRNFITVLGEAISNAWDADATTVEIFVDSEKKSMLIIDDGIGMTSKDFQNWEEHKIVLGDLTKENYQAWAPDLFVDDDGKKYIIYSKQIGTMTDSVVDGTFIDLRPCIVEIKNLKN